MQLELEIKYKYIFKYMEKLYCKNSQIDKL